MLLFSVGKLDIHCAVPHTRDRAHLAFRVSAVFDADGVSFVKLSSVLLRSSVELSLLFFEAGLHPRLYVLEKGLQPIH